MQILNVRLRVLLAAHSRQAQPAMAANVLLVLNRLAGRLFCLRQLQLLAHFDAVALQMVGRFQGFDGGAVGVGNLAQRVAGFDHINFIAAAG